LPDTVGPGLGRMVLGFNVANGSQGWTGIIDELAIYDSALSSAVITAHVEAATTPPPAAGTVIVIR